MNSFRFRAAVIHYSRVSWGQRRVNFADHFVLKRFKGFVGTAQVRERQNPELRLECAAVTQSALGSQRESGALRQAGSDDRQDRFSIFFAVEAGFADEVLR